jgi:hypothetical protein
MVEGCAPRGLRKSAIRVPTQEYCILRQADALLGFSVAFAAFLHSGLDPSLDGSSAPGLYFDFVLDVFEASLQRLPIRGAWHLSIARAPAVLAFSPFLLLSNRDSTF